MRLKCMKKCEMMKSEDKNKGKWCIKLAKPTHIRHNNSFNKQMSRWISKKPMMKKLRTIDTFLKRHWISSKPSMFNIPNSPWSPLLWRWICRLMNHELRLSAKLGKEKGNSLYTLRWRRRIWKSCYVIMSFFQSSQDKGNGEKLWMVHIKPKS